MEAKELKQKSRKEIEQLLASKRDELWKFRFGGSGSKVRNVREGREIRREIARILTVLNEIKSTKSE